QSRCSTSALQKRSTIAPGRGSPSQSRRACRIAAHRWQDVNTTYTEIVLLHAIRHVLERQIFCAAKPNETFVIHAPRTVRISNVSNKLHRPSANCRTPSRYDEGDS